MFFTESQLVPKKPKAKLDRTQAAKLDYVVRDIDWYTDAELLAAKGDELAFDVEVYPNFFCCGFKSVTTGKAVMFEYSPVANFDRQKLIWVMQNFLIIGFNSGKYDLTILWAALAGFSPIVLKQISDEMILQDIQPWEIMERYQLYDVAINHIDIKEVAPLHDSLKKYAARMHCKRLQDLPYDPMTQLTEEQGNVVRLYNINDLDNTISLYIELKPQIKLRERLGKRYGLDLRSLSDAQISEKVILSEIYKKTGKTIQKQKCEPGSRFKYQMPKYVSFKLPILQKLYDIIKHVDFVIGEGGGPTIPQELLDLEIAIGQSVYRIGIGGLHSSEKSIAHFATGDTLLIDRDVASFYPRIKLNQNLFPKQCGQVYLVTYGEIVDERLAAKKSGDKEMADGGKIMVNGGFGNFGNRHKRVYAPKMLLQVTISGQLSILMLIEAIELTGIPVISANTDGVVIKCPQGRYDDLQAVIAEWERVTQFETEETRYSAIFSRDVNSYIAFKLDYNKTANLWEPAGVKQKGAYSFVGSALNSRLSRDPANFVCIDAVLAKLSEEVPIERTIRACRDIARFVTVAAVKGGAHKDGAMLGKVVRWYYAQGERGEINYIMSGNKVPDSDGAKPCMDLPDTFPDDIDYDRYISIAEAMLHDIGYYPKKHVAKPISFFD